MSRLPVTLLHRLLRILSTAITLIFVIQVCVSTVSARNPGKSAKPSPTPVVTSSETNPSTSTQSDGIKETSASMTARAVASDGQTSSSTTVSSQDMTAGTSIGTTTEASADATTQTLEPTTTASSETLSDAATQTSPQTSTTTTIDRTSDETTTATIDVTAGTNAGTTTSTTTSPTTGSKATTTTGTTTSTTASPTTETKASTSTGTTTSTTTSPTTETKASTSTGTTTVESIESTTQATTESSTRDTTAAATETMASLEIFVAPDGRDNGTGSETAPFRTIQYAIDQAVSGTTIFVRAGSYSEKLEIFDKTNLTVVNAPGDRPILTGAGFTGGYLVSIAMSSDIQFSGFELKDFKAPDFEVIYIKNGSSNIEISNCKIHDIAVTQADGNAHAILAKSTTDKTMRNITIKNNKIYNCKTGYSEAVTIQGNVEGFVVSRNVIHDNTNIGIDIAGFYNNACSDPRLNQARKGVVSGNLIYNLYCAYATCAGIYVDGGRDTIIENNTIYNTMYGIEIGCENAVDKVHTSFPATVSGIVVRNNLVYNNTKAGLTNGGYEGLDTGKVIGTKIYGNTFYNNVVEIELSYCDDIMIEKNIIDNSGSSRYFIYSDMPGLATRVRLDNNLYFRQDGASKFKFNGQYAASLSEWQSKFSQDAGSRYADPLFANPADGDFALQDQSPAIGFIR